MMLSSICLSVLALSSRFDGPSAMAALGATAGLSVLALSSRFDGQNSILYLSELGKTFSTRSVESF